MDFNWTTVAVAILNLLIGGGFVAYVKSRPAILKIEADREANLLHERADEMASMRTEIANLTSAMTIQTKVHDAERRADIHRINNLSQCLDALLLLLKQGVAVQDAVDAVEKMRQEQLARENEERAMIRAATITASAPSPTVLPVEPSA